MRTRSILPLVGSLVMLGTAATAQAISDEIDTVGDGQYWFAELSMVHNKLSQEMFTSFDADGEGFLDAAEYETALEDEILREDPSDDD